MEGINFAFLVHFLMMVYSHTSRKMVRNAVVFIQCGLDIGLGAWFDGL